MNGSSEPPEISPELPSDAGRYSARKSAASSCPSEFQLDATSPVSIGESGETVIPPVYTYSTRFNGRNRDARQTSDCAVDDDLDIYSEIPKEKRNSLTAKTRRCERVDNEPNFPDTVTNCFKGKELLAKSQTKVGSTDSNCLEGETGISAGSLGEEKQLASSVSKPSESAADIKAARRAARKAKFATAPSQSSRPVNGEEDVQEGSHIAAFLKANRSFLSRGQQGESNSGPIAQKASLSTVVEGLEEPAVGKSSGDAEDDNEDFLTRPDPLAGAKRILARVLSKRRFGSHDSDPGDILFRTSEWLSEGSDGSDMPASNIVTGKTAIQEVLSDLSLEAVAAMASSSLSAVLASDDEYISGASTAASSTDQRALTEACEPAAPACSDDCSSTRVETGDALPGMTVCQADALEKDLQCLEFSASEIAPAHPTGPNTNRPARVRPKA